jgi:hypothetical protein
MSSYKNSARKKPTERQAKKMKEAKAKGKKAVDDIMSIMGIKPTAAKKVAKKKTKKS